MTNRERLATLEARQQAHGREHGYIDKAWEGQLEAIHLRLVRIEDALNGWRDGLNGRNGRRRLSGRDVGVAGGSMAVATAVWWVVDLLRAAGGA